jgi:hypothetical protein
MEEIPSEAALVQNQNPSRNDRTNGNVPRPADRNEIPVI